MNKHNWKDMQPDDGYFAALNFVGDYSVDLVFGLYVGGTLHKKSVIASRKWPTARIIGDIKRKLIFWEGVAEYMNAGGDLYDVSEELREVKSEFPKIDFKGWSYYDTGINDGNRVHEFISDDPKDVTPMRFVRWIRGEFIDYNLTELDMQDTENNGATDSPTEAVYLRELNDAPEGQAS